MKRIIVFFLVVLMVVSLLSGCQKGDIDNENVNTSTSISSVNQVVENNIEESLAEKLIREIDEAYAEESKLPESSSTAGMVELADKYAKSWQQVADEHYNKIMEYDGIVTLSENYYTADDLHTFVSNMKSNWEQYYQLQCENYVKTLQVIYSGGTIVGPIFANYKYEMQKEWALQMVGIYQQLYIE